MEICSVAHPSYAYVTAYKILRRTVLIFSGHEIPKSAIDPAVREFYSDP